MRTACTPPVHAAKNGGRGVNIGNRETMTQQTTSKTWDADLQEMPLGNLPAFYSTAQDQVDARRQLRSDQKHVSRSDKRLMLDARRLQNCLGHVGRLPEPGESAQA